MNLPLPPAQARAAARGELNEIRRPITKLPGFGKISQLQKSTTPGYDWQFRCRRMLWQDFRHRDFIRLAPFQPGDVVGVEGTDAKLTIASVAVVQEQDGWWWVGKVQREGK